MRVYCRWRVTAWKDPLDYFFRKRALEVKSTSRSDPDPAGIQQNDGALTAAPVGNAGEGIDLHLNPFKRSGMNRWPTGRDFTVDGDAVFNYQVPDYFNGKIRVMAVSVSPDRTGFTHRAAPRYGMILVLTPNIPAMVSG